MTAVRGKKTRKTGAGDVFGLYEKAVKALRAGKYDQASKLLDQIAKESSTEIDVLARVKIFQRICARQMEEGSRTSKRSNSAEATYNLGVFHHNNGDFEEALQEFENALRLAEDDPSFIHYAMAASYICSGNKPGALDALTKAIDKNESFRFSAAHDPDFAVLSKDEGFRTLLESA